MMSTPLELDIAIWYGTRAGDYGRGNGDNNFHFPAVQEALKRFVDAGLLEPNGDCNELAPLERYAHYVQTAKMVTYLRALCAVPWPRTLRVTTGMSENGIG